MTAIFPRAGKGAVPAILILLGCLTECGGVPRVRYYTLATPALGESRPQGGAVSVRVRRLGVAEPYGDRRIVYRRSDTEVGFWELHRWAEPPDRMITARLAEELRASGLFEWVDSFPYSARPVDFVLGGAVLAFEEVDREDGWYGRVELFLELRRSGEAVPLWSERVRAERPAAAKSPEAVVEALSSALDEAFRQAISSMRGALERSR